MYILVCPLSTCVSLTGVCLGYCFLVQRPFTAEYSLVCILNDEITLTRQAKKDEQLLTKPDEV